MALSTEAIEKSTFNIEVCPEMPSLKAIKPELGHHQAKRITDLKFRIRIRVLKNIE